jgi:hypothetical protein
MTNNKNEICLLVPDNFLPRLKTMENRFFLVQKISNNNQEKLELRLSLCKSLRDRKTHPDVLRILRRQKKTQVLLNKILTNLDYLSGEIFFRDITV